ncbi:hypothetical protein OYC64_012905 [Pagothenia borchgrevinki]|uniref:Uncharacterized protein n=1 Tax=Pagothenia borchgrevinki TaxID=8213 RepID=A0ABD2FSR4_PAGBO
MSNSTQDPFYSSPFGPFYRRHAPYMVQPEYRIYEMNKRLQARTEVSKQPWGECLLSGQAQAEAPVWTVAGMWRSGAGRKGRDVGAGREGLRSLYMCVNQEVWM